MTQNDAPEWNNPTQNQENRTLLCGKPLREHFTRNLEEIGKKRPDFVQRRRNNPCVS
jgi:hypothetical protein